jgi:hypothetical protein
MAKPRAGFPIPWANFWFGGVIGSAFHNFYRDMPLALAVLCTFFVIALSVLVIYALTWTITFLHRLWIGADA